MIILFLLILLLLLFFTHCIAYFFFVKALSIKNQTRRRWFFIALNSIPLGFIFFSVLMRITDYPVLNIFYTLTAVGLGFTFTTIFGSLVGYFLLAIPFLRAKIHLYKYLAFSIIFISFFWTVYGIINARIIRVKNLEVEIENLPQEWIGRKAVLFTDAHFGAIYGKGQAIKLAALINRQKPDIIFMSGDMFDGSSFHLLPLIEPLKKLDAPLGKYFATGNHEVYHGSQESEQAVSQIGFTVLDNQTKKIDDVLIAGFAYPENDNYSQEFQKFINTLSTTTPTFLLSHLPRGLKEAQNIGIDFMMSGHTHYGQAWPFHYITQAVFNGYDYGLKSYRSLQIYTSNGVGTWGPPIRTLNSPEIVVITFKDK